MRIVHVAASLPLCLLLALPCCASPVEPSEDIAITQLEQRALQANPREQCFLYTQLVQDMTAQAGKQLLAGDSLRAGKTLARIEHYTHLIHLSLSRDAKRLKQAQMTLDTTAHRLGEYLHRLSPEDKAAVQTTLAQLNQVNDEMLQTVFMQ